MTKYRRVEINAFRRRVTIVSGEWSRNSDVDLPVEQTVSLPSQANSLCYPQTDAGVSLDDTDICEPVAPDSPEGQLILVDAVRSLERRLSPETRATICASQDPLAPIRSKRNSFFLKLQSFYQPIYQKALRFARKEK